MDTATSSMSAEKPLLYGIGSNFGVPATPLVFRVAQISGEGFLVRKLGDEESAASARFRAFRDLAEGFVSDHLHRVAGGSLFCLLDGCQFSSEAAAALHFRNEHTKDLLQFTLQLMCDNEQAPMSNFMTKLMYSDVLYADTNAETPEDPLFPSARATPVDAEAVHRMLALSYANALADAARRKKKKKRKKKSKAADSASVGAESASAGDSSATATLTNDVKAMAASAAVSAAAADAVSTASLPKPPSFRRKYFSPLCLGKPVFSDADLLSLFATLELEPPQELPDDQEANSLQRLNNNSDAAATSSSAATTAHPVSASAVVSAPASAVGKAGMSGPLHKKVEQPPPRKAPVVTASASASSASETAVPALPKESPSQPAVVSSPARPPSPKQKTSPKHRQTAAASPAAPPVPATAKDKKKKAGAGKKLQGEAQSAPVVAPREEAVPVEEVAPPKEDPAEKAKREARDAFVSLVAEEYAKIMVDEVVVGLTETLVRRAHQQAAKEVKQKRDFEAEKLRKLKEAELAAERHRLAEARRQRKALVSAETQKWFARLLAAVVAEECSAVVSGCVEAERQEQRTVMLAAHAASASFSPLGSYPQRLQQQLPNQQQHHYHQKPPHEQVQLQQQQQQARMGRVPPSVFPKPGVASNGPIPLFTAPSASVASTAQRGGEFFAPGLASSPSSSTDTAFVPRTSVALFGPSSGPVGSTSPFAGSSSVFSYGSAHSSPFAPANSASFFSSSHSSAFAFGSPSSGAISAIPSPGTASSNSNASDSVVTMSFPSSPGRTSNLSSSPVRGGLGGFSGLPFGSASSDAGLSVSPSRGQLLPSKPTPVARMIKTVPEDIGFASAVTIEVHNLPRGSTEDEVRALFSGTAEIRRVALLRGPDLGCAMVEFPDVRSAEIAERSAQRLELRGATVLLRRPRSVVGTTGSGQTFALNPGAVVASPLSPMDFALPGMTPSPEPLPARDGLDASIPVSALSYLLQTDDDADFEGIGDHTSAGIVGGSTTSSSPGVIGGSSFAFAGSGSGTTTHSAASSLFSSSLFPPGLLDGGELPAPPPGFAWK